MAPSEKDAIQRIADALERMAPARREDAPADAPAWVWKKGVPVAVRRVSFFDAKDLIGIDDALERVDANTFRFVRGRPANDVLLWGERGTGKSSLIKAMLKRYVEQGLRILSLGRESYCDTDAAVDWVAGRSERFLLFLDDFSFRGDEPFLNELKSLLEGGLVSRPDNLLVYATSNRRHLLPEAISDNQPLRTDDGEIHPSEAMQETLALSDRFGLRVGLYAPAQEVYLRQVDHYLEHYGIKGDRETLHRQAVRFALQSGCRSGRTAHQFAKSLPEA